MSTIKTWTMTQSDLEDTADSIKAVIAEAMVDSGILAADAANKWCASHTLIMRKKNIFKTISDLWEKSEESKGMFFIAVKTTNKEEDK